MYIYFLIGIKTIFFFSIISILLKVMGKRELGQLNTFDIVVFFVISELFSLSVDDPKENVWLSLLPILIIFFLQVIISIFSLKSFFLRNIFEGKPSVIINDGNLDIKVMRKQRYNINDLMEQLRLSNIDSISSVKYAILESNGQLSVVLKENNVSECPFPVIKDGTIDFEVLKMINKDKKWLMEYLKKYNYINEKEIFLCMIEENGLFIIKKD